MKHKVTALALASLSLLMLGVTAKEKYDDYSKVDLAKVHKKITPLRGSTPAQWRITVKGEASSNATVSWSTLDPKGEHILYYGTTSSAGKLEEYEKKQACQRNGKYSGNPKEKGGAVAHYHHAQLTDLKADTTYYLSMVSNGVASKECHFRTAPANPERLVLIHGGDSRTGISARSRVNHMIAKLVENHPEIWGFVHGGDYVTHGNNYSQWKGWMSQHELTTTSKNRILPMIVAKGNHDGGSAYGQIFDFLPKDGPKALYYYNTTFGKFASIVTLDTNIAGTGAQEEFLKDSLAKLRPQSKWLFASYHRPLYPAVKGMPSHKKVFVPHFEKHNVDVGLEADGHNIKRTVPIRADKKDPSGVVYIGEGGLGVGQRTPKSDRWYLDPKAGAYIDKGHHIMLLTMDTKELEIKTIKLDGSVVDNHLIKVRK